MQVVTRELNKGASQNTHVCLPGVESCEFFIYFGDEALVWGISGKYVFPYCWFSLYFNAVFFSPAEAFYFDDVPFVYSFLYVPCFRGRVCEDVAEKNKKIKIKKAQIKFWDIKTIKSEMKKYTQDG